MSFTVLSRSALFTLACAAFAAPARAQIQAFGGSAPRMAATRVFFDQAPRGMVCFQYGQPMWKAEYDAQLDTWKGKQIRLGKDFWTTFNTSIALTFAGTKVDAGSYYVGLKRDAEGSFHLLFMRAEHSDKSGWTPFAPDQWKADYTLPLKWTQGTTATEKMAMDLAVDAKDPTQMTFSLNWGKHVLSAPIQAHLTPAN